MDIHFLQNYNWKIVYDKNSLKILRKVSWLLYDCDYEKVIWCIYKIKFLKYWYFLFEELFNKDINSDFIISSKIKKNKIFMKLFEKMLKIKIIRIFELFMILNYINT